MNLIFSYLLPYSDHYPGELYRQFYDYLKEKYKVNIEYVSLRELSHKYDLKEDYNNGFPSILNPYNLLIINKDNDKTFVHSLHDYAPATLENGSGIEKFDVVKFACVSRLTDDILNNKNKNNILQPSFYMLENISDHDLIVKHSKIEKEFDRVYFNGLSYWDRTKILNIFSKSSKFEIKIKSEGGYIPKNVYYETLSKYKFGFNMDGVAKICYRDLECFGLKTLLLRNNLDINLYDPLQPGKHYWNLFDNEVQDKINNNSDDNELLQIIESKIEDLLIDGNYEYIISEAHSWFVRNCLPKNQIKLLDKFTNNLEIFK